MTHGRNRRGKATAFLGLLAVATAFSVGPAQAEPDVDDVRDRVERLYHQAEQAQERYNDAALRLEGLNSELKALRADERRQGRRLAEVQGEVRDLIVRQYQGEGVSTLGQVVVADDPSSFLGQLTTMQAFGDLQDDALEEFSTEAEALGLRQAAAGEQRDRIAETTEALEQEKGAVETKLAQAKRLLARLEAEEHEEVAASRDHGRVPSDVPASGRAAVAVKAALAQVGDAYVYGAVGPNAYDCSGLTMMAWAQAGVGLPHSSSAQFSSGARVSQGDLQPGDLVFYYSPISHVGMYIGNGQIVHAANPSKGVRIDGVFSMPYVGAVRPG
ncbi:C40 family peptidase [Nocardioides sp. Y6]|uniref:C40 family peptidase n=1 Tax=Nocardioides malaquae TaxID=2773426 RepID=A0ABR9RNY6_9ACTN|nr:NlpC/P60 family protein [Nocardioides malaquae]MBE7323284.1 C40 family peptidase [Nocardioides malaquae]